MNWKPSASRKAYSLFTPAGARELATSGLQERHSSRVLRGLPRRDDGGANRALLAR